MINMEFLRSFLRRHFAVENLLYFLTLASCDLSFFVGNPDCWESKVSEHFHLSRVNVDLMPVVV